MGQSSADLFKDSFDKAFSQPGVSLNSDTMLDAMKFKQDMKEDDEKGINNLDKSKQGMVYGIAQILRKIEDTDNRRKIAKDMVAKFKREKIKFDYNKFLELCKINNKKEETKEATSSASSGAVFGKVAFQDSDFVRKSFEETPKIQKEEIEKVEAKEATTGVGGYSTPAMWAKSTSKKDWGPSRKAQIPGGKFVSVKKKCTKFPYCNQGDINALNISKNESVKEAIKNVSKKYNMSESMIIAILEHEYEKMNKRVK